MTLPMSAPRHGHLLTRICAVFAFMAALVLSSPAAHGQARPPVPRIGFLSFFPRLSVPLADPLEVGFRQGLKELGLVEGQSVVVERRYASFRPDQLAAMTEELVRLKVDVIFAVGQPAREAARKSTGTIPIVTMGGSDPVREGWAKSLAVPGGNVTGLLFTFPELGSKRLELLKEAMPSLSRVAVLIDMVQVVDARDVIRETEAGARRLGLQLQVLEIHGPEDFDAAFERARLDRAQAVLTLAMFPHRSRIAAASTADRLLSMGESSQETDEGFLLAYGADIDDLGRRCVLQLGKILKGARAGDLPIERPAKFRLSVNLKTAKALGVTLPASLLLRADEVVQ
jgi:putative ABC transport system substrate-binding protein